MAPAEAQVPLVERDQVQPEARSAYDHVAEVRGNTMGNVFKALANSPIGLEKVAAVGEFIRGHSVLDPVMRELVILTVAAQTRCAYEWTHHHHWIKRNLSVTPDVLAVAGTPALEQQPDPLGSAIRYARIVAAGEHADHETMDTLKKALGEQGLVELTITIGYYLLLARFINTMHVPIEDGAKPVPFPN